jgi:uncharacterized protein (TIGR03437 family)
MLGKALLCLALCVGGAAAATPSFPLGLDYSEWIPTLGANALAVDGSGAMYILEGTGAVTKLSADGNAVVWRSGSAFVATAMAVDPAGDVFVTIGSQLTPSYVAKVMADGSGLVWKLPIGLAAASTSIVPLIAADSNGRVYVAAGCSHAWGAPEACVARIKADGTALEYSTTAAAPGANAMAVSSSGEVYIVGYGVGGDSVAQLAADGSAGYVANLPQSPDTSPSIAVDPSGNAVVLVSGTLDRVDSTGTVTPWATVATGSGKLAIDSAGNAYVSSTNGELYRATNSVAACGVGSSFYFMSFSFGVKTRIDISGLLTVVAPNGKVLQSTYLPGAVGSALLAVGPDAAVHLVAGTTLSVASTRTGPDPTVENGALSLMQLSANANAQPVSLVCIGNAATYNIETVAPGEIVTLFGNGIGPVQGVETSATLDRPYPTQAGGVEVTFDGIPAPLLWVQATQINLAVPWSVAGPITEVCVTYNKIRTNCLHWATVPAAPTVFTIDGFYAAALNQDGTINSAANPAPPGSIVALFATGLGPITPVLADGALVPLPLPTNTLAVTLQVSQWVVDGCGGNLFPFGSSPPFSCYLTFSYTPAYAGPAPFLIAGASQINVNASDFANLGTANGAILVIPSVLTGTLQPTTSNKFGIYVYVATQ